MIRRRRKVREIEFSFDSFLDVVANVVGIILRLILVAWVGARSYQVVVPGPQETLTPEEIAELPDPHDPLSVELERQRRELAETQAKLLEQVKDWQKLRQDSTLTAEELSHLTADVQNITSERKNLDDKTRQDVKTVRDAALSLDEIRERTKRVVAEIEALRKLPPQKQTLRYRTPVSRDLQTLEFQFECRNGRVTFVDFASFIADVDKAGQDEGVRAALHSTGRYENVTEKYGHFRTRFVLERNPVTSRDESYAELEPVTPVRGETLERALADGSEFRRFIDNINPKEIAVTLWVYPDSFPLYRKLRDYIDERDIVVAGRALPESARISFGSRGTLSRGQ